MPSKSDSQQRLFQVALAVKKGDKDLSDLPDSLADKVKGIVDDMSQSEIEDFAKKKEEAKDPQIEARLKEMIRNHMYEVYDLGYNHSNTNLREFAVRRGVNDPKKTEKLLKKIAKNDKPKHVDGITIDHNVAEAALEISDQLDIPKADFFSRPLAVITGIASKYVGKV